MSGLKFKWLSSKLLQWGRGLLTPEMAVDASIPELVARASMGPGSFDPGNAAADRLDAPPISLQWGRGLLTPEMQRYKHAHRRSSALQWGRGLLTPEMRSVAAKPANYDPGFNGAGVF